MKISTACEEIPDFRAIRNSLQILAMENSQLTQVRGDNLKNLTQLQRLSFVNNSIAHVADDVFQGTKKVKYFDITHNRLTCLPPSLFESWKGLKEVRLTHNQLLHVDHLFLGRNPKVRVVEGSKGPLGTEPSTAPLPLRNNH
ncbi:hypothetical protein CDAR_603311 [Caerostris darwini]|uniref:Biglycan n=1 Tax=Caerostris darwini TaxID=1538125 RepID=A0AAV4SP80_9ARAC|nr:hypothetical protein CDAR_603311 [Caerostris darwini]